MREQLNRILRTEKIDLLEEDPLPLLRMLSVALSELSNITSSHTINTADIAALAARSTRHVFAMISDEIDTEQHQFLKRKIISKIESIFSRHIPGITTRFNHDYRERMLICALFQVSDAYRNIPLDWLPYVPKDSDWHALAVANLSDILQLADKISSGSYSPVLNNTNRLLIEYAAIQDVA
jgi:hypothetical protein